MKLHLTATSERGKPVTKSGNTVLEMNIVGEQRQELWHIVILPNIDGGQLTVYKNGNHIFEDLSDKPKTLKCGNCGAVECVKAGWCMDIPL